MTDCPELGTSSVIVIADSRPRRRDRRDRLRERRAEAAVRRRRPAARRGPCHPAGLAIDRERAYGEATRGNRLKDEFLATLSHELRTPLNAIVGYSTLLVEGTLDRPGEVRAFATIGRNAASLTQIVEDVLDVSRIVSGRSGSRPRRSISARSRGTPRRSCGRRPTPRASSLTSTSSRICPWSPGIRIVFSRWSGTCSPTRVKFTPRGGFVRVTVSCRRSRRAPRRRRHGIRHRS